MTIVIADDDRLMRRIMQRTLENAGYHVIAAENGQVAVEHLSSADGPRLGLVDWVMPVLDGPEVCRAIRARKDRPYVYLILLTAKESRRDLIDGLEAGADDYLTKPCDSEELKARLRSGHRILQLQDRLIHEARHDALTGLPNRAYFVERLTACVQRASDDPAYMFAVLFIDLDRFKNVNDTLGHSAGDALLTEIAKRLLKSVRMGSAGRPSDMVARMGGDEFIVLLDGIQNSARPAAVAERIRRDLAPAFMAGGHDIRMTASVGVSISTPNCSGAEEMLRSADAAMYRAKATRDIVLFAGPMPLRRLCPASRRALRVPRR